MVVDAAWNIALGRLLGGFWGGFWEAKSRPRYEKWPQETLAKNASKQECSKWALARRAVQVPG